MYNFKITTNLEYDMPMVCSSPRVDTERQEKEEGRMSVCLFSYACVVWLPTRYSLLDTISLKPGPGRAFKHKAEVCWYPTSIMAFTLHLRNMTSSPKHVTLHIHTQRSTEHRAVVTRADCVRNVTVQLFFWGQARRTSTFWVDVLLRS